MQPNTASSLELDIPRYVNNSRLVVGALVTGVVGFAAVVGILYFQGQSDESPAQDRGLLNVLSYVHLGLALLVWTLASPLSHKLERRLSAQLAFVPKGAATSSLDFLLKRLFGIHIMRLAMFEGVAMFGLVLCVIAATGGVLKLYPIYAANALSAVVFVFVALVSLPSQTGIQEKVRELQRGE